MRERLQMFIIEPSKFQYFDTFLSERFKTHFHDNCYSSLRIKKTVVICIKLKQQ